MSANESTCQIDPSKFKKIGEGNSAEFYQSQNTKLTYKIFKNTCDSYQYQDFLNEVKNNIKIEELIKANKLSGDLYIHMLNYIDCCKNHTEESFSALIVYPYYPTSLHEIIDGAKETDLAAVAKLLADSLMSYLILYQGTGMIHGNFTYNNVLIGESGPILSDFSKMLVKPCKDHIKEFIWFILQINNYIKSGKEWLARLIRPKFVQAMAGLPYEAITKAIEGADAETIQSVFDYWIQ